MQVDSLPAEPPRKPHASKVMFKVLQTKCQQYLNRTLPDIQAGFRKGRCILYSNYRKPKAKRNMLKEIRKEKACVTFNGTMARITMDSPSVS